MPTANAYCGTRDPAMHGSVVKIVAEKDVEDTYIDASQPYATNGNSTFVTVDLRTPLETRGLLKFALPASAELELMEIWNATLRLYTRSATSGTVRGYRMQTAWSEDTATWNYPWEQGNGVDLRSNDVASSMPSFEITSPNHRDVVTVDVTADVLEWMANEESNQGWVLVTDSTDGFDFFSSDNVKRRWRNPRLDIYYCKSFLSSPPFGALEPSPPPSELVQSHLRDTAVGCNSMEEFFVDSTSVMIRQDDPWTVYASEEELIVDGADPLLPTQALLQFESISKDLFPPHAILESASLHLTTITAAPGPVYGNRMIQAWNESTASWSFFGGNGIQANGVEAHTASFVLTDLRDGQAGVDIDVTEDVRNWFFLDVESRNHGWVFTTLHSKGWRFASSQHSTPFWVPELTIQVSVCSPPSAGPTLAPPTTTTRLPTLPSRTESPLTVCTENRVIHLSDSVDTVLRKDASSSTEGHAQSKITVDAADPQEATQALLQFRSVGPLLSSAEAGETIHTATLSLYSASSSSGPISIHRLRQAWNEKTATWNSFGANGVQADGVQAVVTPTAVLTDVARGVLVNINVTHDVSLWVTDKKEENHGWVFTTESTDGWDFFSSERPNDKVPQLTIEILCVYATEPSASPPSPSPPAPPSPPPGATYVPGNLTVLLRDKYARRVLVSAGLTGRAIAYSGQVVDFADGTSSSSVFHSRPDAAGVFVDDLHGGYVYTSNSESRSRQGGGVYSLRFDENHNVVGYFPVLTGTSFNCGGGRSPWNTWISCEENGDRGRVWQVDPLGQVAPQGNRTALVERGGTYESVAFQMVTVDDDDEYPVFYTTEDREFGGDLVRFEPDAAAKKCFQRGQWCALESGTYSYLRLDFDPNARRRSGGGTFSFGPRDQANGDDYPYSEGIDVKDNMLYFVSKTQKRLYILDLELGTFTYSSTRSGAFEHQPDQVKRILGDDGGDDDMSSILYFAEDSTDCDGTCGVHGRDSNGQFFSILEGIDYDTETTGIAFSPDATRLYVAFQDGDPAVVWQFWRTDGLPFGGQYLDIKYHEA